MFKRGVKFSLKNASSAMTFGALLFVSGLGSSLAGQLDGPAAKFSTEITVEFSSDCASAVVRSSTQVSSLAVVLSNGAWEKTEGLDQAPSYSIAVDPNGPNGDAVFDVLYVESGTYQQLDPLGIVPGLVGMGFSCGKG